MKKVTPIKRSVQLTSIEMMGFLVLCVIQAKIAPYNAEHSLLANAVVNFMNGYLALIIGIVTTWYVIFTYYLMSSTIEFNRQVLDPFVYITWEVCTEELLFKADISKDSPKDGLSEEPGAWVCLVISNMRTKPIDKASVLVSIHFDSPEWTRKPYNVQFEKHGLGIEINRSIKIGIINMSRVPRDVLAEMEIIRINYRANDSTADHETYNGLSTFSYNGMGMMIPGNMPIADVPSGGVR